MRASRRRRRGNREIAPEDIFLEAENTGAFDRSRFEGRLEKPLSRATYLATPIVLGVALFGLGARAADLQIRQGDELAAQSANNALEVTPVFAPRGLITDMHGTILVDNEEGENGSVRRRYLYPEMGQIVGYVSYPKKDASGNYYDTTMEGIAGLEREFDEHLAGENGELLVETDALGRVRSSGTRVRAIPGKTLRLSIDADLERHFARAISERAKKTGFIAGAGVILDIHTGEIRAIVSHPSYDPNVMSEGKDAERIASYNTDAGHPFLDHAVAGNYTPGSIVKPFVAAGVLEDGLIAPETKIVDNALLTIPDPYNPGNVYRYTGWKALGPVNLREAIGWSSDIYFYTVGGGFKDQKGLGIERLNHWYRVFGFGAPTGVALAGEASGLLPDPAWKKKTFNEPWYLGDTYFTAIGQYSMQVTPIQAARAAAAVANGGTLYTPILVAGTAPVGTQVPVDAQNLEIVRQGMRFTVTGALAQALNFPFVSVAAKTGTAQTGTRNQYDNSWVIGFFPYENPQWAFAVVLERGPEGAGSQAVQVMKDLFVSLHEDNSIYVGGTGEKPEEAPEAEAPEAGEEPAGVVP